MVSEIMHPDLFYHKSLGRVDDACAFHDHRKRFPEKRNLEQEETIFYAGQLYRGFLEDVISGLYNPGLSADERTIWVDEAYRKSDFDWRDEEKFWEFFRWIKEEQEKVSDP